MTHVYVTKYAFTLGIKKCEVIKERDRSVKVKWTGERSSWILAYGENEEWCRTPEAAQACVVEMAKAKIKALISKRAALEAILNCGVPITEVTKND